jgi:4-hydroxybenzoate polyprenyltransferase
VAPIGSAGSRLAGLIRLVHPFPSLLDGVATVAIALVAGGDPASALRLGGSMVALQASIGAFNDVMDARADADRKPGKPIPSGLISADEGRTVAVGGAALGLALATPSGPGVLVIAGLGLGIGYGYDIAAKGTSWSWLPFALGTPVLPVFAWVGATGGLPAPFALLIPAAVVAGASLAIANARADLERDRAAGLVSVAARLGPGRAPLVQAGLMAGVVVVALGSLWLAGAGAAFTAAAAGGAAVIGAGFMVAPGPRSSAARRERAWELQAVGVAMLAAAWLAGVAGLC